MSAPQLPPALQRETGGRSALPLAFSLPVPLSLPKGCPVFSSEHPLAINHWVFPPTVSSPRKSSSRGRSPHPKGLCPLLPHHMHIPFSLCRDHAMSTENDNAQLGTILHTSAEQPNSGTLKGDVKHTVASTQPWGPAQVPSQTEGFPAALTDAMATGWV